MPFTQDHQSIEKFAWLTYELDFYFSVLCERQP